MHEPSSAPEPTPPSLADIERARARLGDRVRRTPVWEWQGDSVAALGGTRVFLKLELFQHAGSFKARGALLRMDRLSSDERERGVTAVSAGNHAMAVGYAARALGCSAKVVMPRNANPARVAGCRAYGAQVVPAEDVHDAFVVVEQLVRDEGRTFVHPFEGEDVCLGTAGVGLELIEQVDDLDAVIVPIGGGGLMAGVSTVIKAMRPRCQVFGVEPVGADTMHRSFASGRPESIDRVRTIADSLGAPRAEPYSLAMCRRHVDELVRVDDHELCASMARIFSETKLVVEPAAAAAGAALWGPLRERLAGSRVGLIVCGANIDSATLHAYVTRGREWLESQR